MIGSSEVNKEIRNTLSPTLKESGFNKVNTRHNWAWFDHCIWVVDIIAVGKYFSDLTGWSPMSIHVDLGIYFDFVPPENDIIKTGIKVNCFLNHINAICKNSYPVISSNQII